MENTDTTTTETVKPNNKGAGKGCPGMPKPGSGRKPYADSPKTAMLFLRVTPAEKDSLNTGAKDLAISVANYIRIKLGFETSEKPPTA